MERLLEERHRDNADTKTLVFTEYRDTVDRLVERLSRSEHLSPIPFVRSIKKPVSERHDAKGTGRTNRCLPAVGANVLVATSVGEEGWTSPPRISWSSMNRWPAPCVPYNAVDARVGTLRAGVVMLVAEGTKGRAHAEGVRREGSDG
ncbi:MAG: hypothetical protein CM15mP79_1750 [Methanobacteriota archaeon]|nr:MAG: hypothetical protein CM15mP79_1750 [Euryarchaeota archaeon]